MFLTENKKHSVCILGGGEPTFASGFTLGSRVCDLAPPPRPPPPPSPNSSPNRSPSSESLAQCCPRSPSVSNLKSVLLFRTYRTFAHRTAAWLPVNLTIVVAATPGSLPSPGLPVYPWPLRPPAPSLSNEKCIRNISVACCWLPHVPPRCSTQLI